MYARHVVLKTVLLQRDIGESVILDISLAEAPGSLSDNSPSFKICGIAMARVIQGQLPARITLEYQRRSPPRRYKSVSLLCGIGVSKSTIRRLNCRLMRRRWNMLPFNPCRCLDCAATRVPCGLPT